MLGCKHPRNASAALPAFCGLSGTAFPIQTDRPSHQAVSFTPDLRPHSSRSERTIFPKQKGTREGASFIRSRGCRGMYFCAGGDLYVGRVSSSAAGRRAAGLCSDWNGQRKRLHVLLILSWRSGGGNSIRNSVRSVHQAGDDLQYLGNGNGISHAFHIRG